MARRTTPSQNAYAVPEGRAARFSNDRAGPAGSAKARVVQ